MSIVPTWLRQLPGNVRERLARNEQAIRLYEVWREAQPLGPIRPLAQYYHWFETNVIFRACCQEVASSYATAPLIARRRLRDGSTEDLDDEHPLSKLLANPNPEEGLSAYTYRERVSLDVEIGGISFVQVIRAAGGRPVRLWPLQSVHIKVKTKGGRLDHWMYGKKRLEAEDVIVVGRVPDPLDDWWGLPPAIRRACQIDEKQQLFVESFWNNNAIPALLIKLKTKMTTRKGREAIEEQFAERYGAGGMRVMAHDADVEIEKVGQDFSELRLGDMFAQTESWITCATQVPAVIIGARFGVVNTQWASYKAARRSFWDEKMDSVFNRLGSGHTTSLATEFGSDLEIVSDKAQVEALQESHEEKRRFGLDAWNAGAITLNQFEVFSHLPLTPMPEGGMRRPNVWPQAQQAAATGKTNGDARRVGGKDPEPVSAGAPV